MRNFGLNIDSVLSIFSPSILIFLETSYLIDAQTTDL